MAKKGQEPWNKGLTGISDETRRKMRLMKLGKPRAPIRKKKICLACSCEFQMTNNRQRTCTPCYLEGHGERYATYGLTKQEYMRMIDEQNGLCKFCGKQETQKTKGTLRSLSVDHDHQTNKVRGLLCSTCNLYVVGRHTIESAQRLLAYLEMSA